jgi:glutamine synthetase
MIRIPDKGRFELRLMDGSANPYLLQAGIIVAGLDGINNKRDPGKALNINMYTDGKNLRGLRKLPENLLDAIRLFEKSKTLKQGFGEELVTSYAKLKHSEWKNCSSSISSWEWEHTLDC